MTVIEQLIKQLKKKSASTDYGRGDALPGSLGALRSNRAGWVDLFQLLDRDLGVNLLFSNELILSPSTAHWISGLTRLKRPDRPLFTDWLLARKINAFAFFMDEDLLKTIKLVSANTRPQAIE